MHINVEICSFIFVVKYLYKYVYKGFDCATIIVKRRADMPSQENNMQAVVANGEWQTAMKLKHTLKDTMFLLPKHCGVFSPLECMTWHHLSHALPCTSLECIRLCTIIMSIFLKLLIASKTRKQQSPNTSKPILITPWPEKPHTWIFPLCLHGGPMGRKNGPSSREGAMSSPFISLVLLLTNAIFCVHY